MQEGSIGYYSAGIMQPEMRNISGIVIFEGTVKGISGTKCADGVAV